jgi:biotin carboxyl carrier protein
MTENKDRYLVTLDGREFDLELSPDGDAFLIETNGSGFRVSIDQLSEKKYLLNIDDSSTEFDITRNGGSLELFIDGHDVQDRVEPYHLAELSKLAGGGAEGPEDKTIAAPMPGLVLSTEVSSGDKVVKGQTVMIIEAMKMENLIKAPFDGNVKELFVGSGQAVDKNDKLLELE